MGGRKLHLPEQGLGGEGVCGKGETYEGGAWEIKTESGNQRCSW